MRVANICWYLCGLLAVALLLTSAITVHPNAQREIAMMMGVEAVLCVGFGVLGIVFKWMLSVDPPWLVRTFQCLAVLVTILVVFIAIA